MEGLALKAATRDILGKKTRFLRRQGITPTHLFGHNLKSIALQCNTTELKRTIAHAGMTTIFSLEVDREKQPRKVLIREIQHDALGKQILHVDFYQIIKTQKLKVEIPILLVGEAPAMKIKGRLLMHPLTTLSVECLPDKLPPEIEVDISSLEEVDQAIHVKDLTLDPAITVTSEPDQLIAKISEITITKVAEEEVPTPVAAEPGEQPAE